MSTQEWSAGDYSIGSYIQTTVAKPYLENLPIGPRDAVLDIGCGDGSFSLNILHQFPMAFFVGIDASLNMLALAKKTLSVCQNAHVVQADVENMSFENCFNCIVSFWCLQWTKDISSALRNIHQALLPGGRLVAIFPSGDDPFMTTFKRVVQSGKFKELEKFVPTVDYEQLASLDEKMIKLSFESFVIKLEPQSIVLPSLDVFRKFVNGIAFFQGQIAPKIIKKINEAMTQEFADICQLDHQGKWCFEFSNVYLQAKK